jgi:hypothetical protein
MADPLAPTVPERGRAAEEPRATADETAAPPAPEGSVVPGALAQAPIADPLERALAKAKAAAALFGDVVAVKVGRYRLIERAGAGGMGVVWSAWDPELNRGVALKLASAGDAAARAFARDEGRALAKLSHPNVVPIYDVFEAPEGVFLVMELVAGQTLRAYATGASVAELVRAYRQCGEGLAAAHRAGLIHRDFKPDNAILGADGRVRVLDFGLAHAVDADERPLVAGTPRYMAPEQQRGDPLTAAVDQYALCVALREALSSRGAVPSWLEPIVNRGAAAEPGARFATMDELVAALALDPRARWRRRLAIGAAVGAVGAVAVAFTLGRRGVSEPPCRSSAALIATAWGGAARTAANTHLAALSSPYAAESVPRVIAALDRYAADWSALHRDSCLAHVRGEVSTPAYDRRTACLARRKAALATIGAVAGAVTADGLPGLVNAVSGLPELGACADDATLLSPVAPPPPTQAAEAAAIAELIAAVDVRREAGEVEAATRDAELALSRAEALGYPPLSARALVARGRIALTLRTGDRGAADFNAAARLAVAVGDDALAIEAYARAAYALATTGSVAQATGGLPLVEALAGREGPRATFAGALLQHNVGVVDLVQGDRAAARTRFEAARQASVGLAGSARIEMMVALQSLLLVVDDDAQRAALGEALVAERTRALGPNHPLTLEAAYLRAGVLPALAASRDAMRAACEALARYHPSHRQLIRECSLEVAWRSSVMGDRAVARAAAAQVVALADDGVKPDKRLRAEAYLLLDRDPAAALAQLAAAVTPPADAPWFAQLAAVDDRLVVAQAELARGRVAAARAALDDARVRATAIVAAAPVLVGHRLEAIAALTPPP